MIFCVQAMLPELYMPSLNWDSDVKADFVATVADVLRGTPVGCHTCNMFFFLPFYLFLYKFALQKELYVVQ